MRDDLGVQFPYATPVASAAHRLSGRSSSALSLLDCIVRYLVETSRRREMKQSLTNTVDVPLDFTSSSSTHHDINIEIGSDAPIPRTNSTNNLILTNLSQDSFAKPNYSGCANIDENRSYPMLETNCTTCMGASRLQHLSCGRSDLSLCADSRFRVLLRAAILPLKFLFECRCFKCLNILLCTCYL